jgi:hypothetical protein
MTGNVFEMRRPQRGTGAECEFQIFKGAWRVTLDRNMAGLLTYVNANGSTRPIWPERISYAGGLDCMRHQGARPKRKRSPKAGSVAAGGIFAVTSRQQARYGRQA